MKDLLAFVATPWPILLVTPFFLVFFVLVCVWALSRSRKELYAKLERLPLEEEK